MSSLDVSHLKIWDSRTGHMLVPDSSFRVASGSCLALVGESGSGKSLTCRALLRLLPPELRQSGDIVLDGTNLSTLAEKDMRSKRGKQLCLIMQQGMRAFDPSCVIGVHLKETLARHTGWPPSEIIARMTGAMERVRLKDPVAVMNSYPYQLSGGMLQRVMIALALVLEPNVVIADEPTTALDTISQFEVIEQLIRLREQIGCAMLFVSHDLAVVRRIADEVLVMKDGQLVESGTTEGIFTEARHEYTRRLVDAKRGLRDHFKRIMGGDSVVDR